MPTYVYKHPEKEEYIEVIQSMNEDHTYFDKEGLEWKREWTNPQLNCESNIDPFSNSDFIEKTGKMKGTVGDMQDYSKELSQKRAEMNGGVDPVRQKYYSNYSKQRKGAKHPNQQKERSFESENFKINYD
tara:strand:+ start:891 stop:1280 length:390 start_codon:yes stop_codon:yes gene_type:complete